MNLLRNKQKYFEYYQFPNLFKGRSFYNGNKNENVIPTEYFRIVIIIVKYDLVYFIIIGLQFAKKICIFFNAVFTTFSIELRKILVFKNPKFLLKAFIFF